MCFFTQLYIIDSLPQQAYYIILILLNDYTVHLSMNVLVITVQVYLNILSWLIVRPINSGLCKSCPSNKKKT